MAITSTLTASDVITLAMREIGLLASGETPTGQETEDALTALNFMLKSWQSRGVTSWRNTDGSIAFPQGTAAMALTPYCIDVLDAQLVQSPGYERPLQRWEIGKYREIPNKQTPGYPVAYTITKTDTAINMTLWPVPSQDLTVNYGYVRVIEDITDGAQSIDVPQQWLETVYLGLASRLTHTFGITRIDPAAAQSVGQRAAALEQLLLDADRPASVFMGPTYGRTF